MDKEDARYQTLLQLHERRKQVIRLFNKGYGVMTIAELSGLSYPTVRRTIDCFKEGGMQAIAPTDRGRKTGEGRRLTVEQEEEINTIIREKQPQEFEISHAVWTRNAVLELIAKHCGITLSIRGVGNYLMRWEFTPQKPITASAMKAASKKLQKAQKVPKAHVSQVHIAKPTYGVHGLQ